ncbi:hypothetical protein D1872_267840 [compost metagenome]
MKPFDHTDRIVETGTFLKLFDIFEVFDNLSRQCIQPILEIVVVQLKEKRLMQIDGTDPFGFEVDELSAHRFNLIDSDAYLFGKGRDIDIEVAVWIELIDDRIGYFLRFLAQKEGRYNLFV